MISLQQFSDLLEVLYSAPLDQEQWQRFLTLIREHTGSKIAALLCADSRRGLSGRAVGASSTEIEIAAQYNERHAHHDPFRALVIRNAKIGVFQCDDLMPKERLVQTDIYRELLAPSGLRYGTFIPLVLSVRRLDNISIWRTPEAGPMDEDGNQLLNLLLPHILKAAEISRVLDVAQQARAGAEAMADASPTATFLIDRQGCLVHSNAAADAIVADGTALTLQNGVLTPTSHSSRAALRKILLALAGPPDLRHSNGGQNHAILLPRTDHRPPLQLIATHVPKSQSLSTGAEVLVLVTDPQKAVQFPDDVLRQLYGLTPAEIEVANGILTGYSPNEIADLRHVSKGTVRNQLKALMGKISTSRQSDLVRLLMTVPQPLSN